MFDVFEFCIRVFFDKFLTRTDSVFRVIVRFVARNTDFERFGFGDGIFDLELQRAERFRFKSDVNFMLSGFEIADLAAHGQNCSERKFDIAHRIGGKKFAVAQINRDLFVRNFAPVNLDGG